MMNEPNYYAILRIGRTASYREIREAYVQRLRDAHPDVERLYSYPIVRLEDIQTAYRCLSNDETRAAHDADLHAIELRRTARLRRVRRQAGRENINETDQGRYGRGPRPISFRQRLLAVALLLIVATELYSPGYLDRLIGLDKIWSPLALTR